MKRVISLFFVFLSFAYSFAQNTRADKFNDASLLMDDKQYIQALNLWLDLLETEPNNSNFNYKAGFCYLNSSSNRAKSLSYLEKASASTTRNYNIFSAEETNAPVECLFYLGKAYHLNNQIDKAIQSFEKFKETAGKKHYLVNDANHQIEMCNNAKELMANPLSLKISNLGNKINSSESEHSPVTSLDENALYFTSRRLRTDSSNYIFTDRNDGKHFEDIYVSYKDENGEWSEPELLNFSRNNDHDATIGLSADGLTLYIYRDDEGDGNIYQATLFGDRWTAPVKMKAGINTKSAETHISVAADDRTLYFVSDRKGGQGGKDIYRCVKLPNGEWSLPLNLGPTINTPYNEDAPFIHPDGKTLYFISEGHKSMGGYDIFFTELQEDGKWTKPENVGYPVNTTDDDISYFLSPDGKRAYYSSFKADGFGDKDIYMIEQPGAIEVALTLVKGYIKVPEGQDFPEDIRIVMTDNETGQFIAESKPLKRNGSFVFIIPPGKNYNLSYELNGKEFYNENIYVPIGSNYQEVEKAINLDPLKLGLSDDAVVVKNISKDDAKARFQFRYKNLSAEIPEGTLVEYLDKEGNVIFSEKLNKDGFFPYKELPSDNDFIFRLSSLDKSKCKDAEIVLVGKKDAAIRLIADENCIFRKVENRPRFLFTNISKDLPTDLKVQYLDNNGNVLFEEQVDNKGYFKYDKLPAEQDMILKLVSADANICQLGEITMPTPDGNYIKMKADENCVFRKVDNRPRFVFSNLGKENPEGLTIQYLDYDGNVLYEEKLDKNGRFNYRELPAEQEMIFKLITDDISFCEAGEIIVPGLGGEMVKMRADKNCVFRIVKEENQQTKFVFNNLKGDLPADLTVLFLDEKGNVLYEEKVNKNGTFNFRKLGPDQPVIIKLKSTDAKLCNQAELNMPGPGGTILTLKPDANCVYRVTDKKWQIDLAKLGSDVPEGLIIQYVDDKGKILFEEPVNKNGTFAYHKLSSEKNYLFKLKNENPELCDKLAISLSGAFSNESIRIFPGENCTFTSNPEKAKSTGVKYAFVEYFEYNKKSIPDSDPQYIEFMKNLDNLAKSKEYVNVTIESSASKVPTKTFKNNMELTKLRAEDAKQKLLNAMKAKGYDTTKLIFVNISTLVQGPSYKGDAQKNRKEYEKYQYVKIWAY